MQDVPRKRGRVREVEGVSIKDWPDNGKPADFGELAESVYPAITFAYRLERINEGQAIPWKGHTIGKEDLATCFAPDEQLSAENLRYDEEDQGRDALQVLIGIAMQLGIEQGRRMTRQKVKEQVSLLHCGAEILNAAIETLTQRYSGEPTKSPEDGT